MNFVLLHIEGVGTLRLAGSADVLAALMGVDRSTKVGLSVANPFNGRVIALTGELTPKED